MCTCKGTSPLRKKQGDIHNICIYIYIYIYIFVCVCSPRLTVSRILKLTTLNKIKYNFFYMKRKIARKKETRAKNHVCIRSLTYVTLLLPLVHVVVTKHTNHTHTHTHTLNTQHEETQITPPTHTHAHTQKHIQTQTHTHTHTQVTLILVRIIKRSEAAAIGYPKSSKLIC